MAKYQVKRVKDFKADADKECSDDEPKAARSNAVNQTSVINKTIRALREKAKAVEDDYSDDLSDEELDAFAAKLNLGQAAGNLARGVWNKLRGKKPPYTFWVLTNDGSKIDYEKIGELPKTVSDNVLFEWAKIFSSTDKPENLVLVSLSDGEQEHFWAGRKIEDNDAGRIIRNGGVLDGITLRG